MGKSITAIIPVDRADLTPVFVAGVVGLIKSRLANLTLGNSGKKPGTNGWQESAKLNSEMAESLESWRCVFPLSEKNHVLHGVFSCHGDHEEIHKGYKLLFSVADNDELMQVLQYVTSGFGGFIERNGDVSIISQEPVSIKQVVRDDNGEMVAVDGGELTLPSILHAFKQSYLLERLPIPEGLVDTVYLNEYSNMSQVGLFSFEDRQWSLIYKLPELKTKSQSLMLYKYPDWATHIIQHKTNKDLRRCVKLNGDKMLGGYEFGENDFSVEYSSQDWDVLYSIAEEIARFDKGELAVQTA